MHRCCPLLINKDAYRWKDERDVHQRSMDDKT
jgi:hypothetical protein